MDKLTSRDVLELWESTWGPLDEKWKESFLTHQDMQEILKFNYRQIDFCIRQTKKLENLLKVLRHTLLLLELLRRALQLEELVTLVSMGG